ncbi:MAG: TRAP transporter small permease [Spirochaetaceae bacterium]|nr:TRAP transporter small permease [Spirochaetaceae bacterium]
MNTFKKYLDKAFQVLLYFAMFLLVAMVVIVFTNVVLRYGFSSGIRWGEEAPLIIVIWFTFIAMALGVKENLHISITVFTLRANRVVNDLLDILKYVIQLGIGIIIFRYGWLLTLNGLKSFLPATHITNAINYIILPISAIFIIGYSLCYLFENIKDIKNPKQERKVENV